MTKKEINIPIINIMHETVITADASDSIQLCAIKMTKERVGCIIITEAERPVGIITERGFADLVAAGNFDCETVTAKECMSSPLITIDPDANYTTAIEIFTREDIKRLPVVEGERVIGLLTLKNMVEYSRLTIDLLHRENQNLQSEVTVDALTGVYNKAAIEEMLEIEHKRLKTESGRSSILFLDIDHFKYINDQYSHLAGDQVLSELSELLKSVCRDTDLVGRFGGEEFIIIARNQKEPHALLFAERLRTIIEAHPFRFKEQTITVTISIGVFGLSAIDEEYTASLERADQAMYFAKQQGRNCIGHWNNDVLQIAEF